MSLYFSFIHSIQLVKYTFSRYGPFLEVILGLVEILEPVKKRPVDKNSDDESSDDESSDDERSTSKRKY